MTLATEPPPPMTPTGDSSTRDCQSLRRRRAPIHPLVWILLVGIIVRIGLWLAWANWSPLINDDARDYHGLAFRLVTTGSYSNESGQLISLRPPLYPAFVAGTYLTFGLENDAAVRSIQAVLGLVTACMVYRLGILAYSRQVALWAAGIVCFYPSLLGYANLLLSETLFTFLVVAFTWLMFEALHQRLVAILAAAGIVMGLAALTRSIVLLFSPFVLIWILFSWQGHWGRRLLAAALPLVAFAAVIAPWAIRNTRIQETLTIIDVMGGRNAMMGNYEYTPLERSWATISDVPEQEAWYRVLHRERHSDAPLTQGQIDKLALRHAINFVLQHPWLTAQRDLVKFFNFWQLERLLVAAAGTGYFGDLPTAAKLLLAAVICGVYAFVLLTAIFGACCCPPRDRRTHWFLVVSILLPCVIHTLVFAHSRYHLPVVPFLALCAAAAIVHRQEIWQLRRTWAFKLAAALCVIVVLGWIREFVFVDLYIVNRLTG
jgi:4-amino-4-deoxy-L-arabinose transferase-like glycosyltransferase